MTAAYAPAIANAAATAGWRITRRSTIGSAIRNSHQTKAEVARTASSEQSWID